VGFSGWLFDTKTDVKGRVWALFLTGKRGNRIAAHLVVRDDLCALYGETCEFTTESTESTEHTRRDEARGCAHRKASARSPIRDRE